MYKCLEDKWDKKLIINMGENKVIGEVVNVFDSIFREIKTVYYPNQADCTNT